MLSKDEAFYETGLVLLKKSWSDVLSMESTVSNFAISNEVDRVFECKTGSYKKAAIVQALGKATDLRLDAQAVQKGEADETAWNARTFAQKTFVIWNEEAKQPFNHSGDPYVSNPLRIPRFDDKARMKARDKAGFDALMTLLTRVNAATTIELSRLNLVQVLLGLRRYISDKSVDYPLPKRVNQGDTLKSINEYLALKSGGARLQAVVAAMFQSLSQAGLKIGEVSTGNINAPDVSSKKGGDIEFDGFGGSFAVEVKDRPLAREEYLSSIEKARIVGLSDLMFVVGGSPVFSSNLSRSEFDIEADSQFSSGLNIYIESFEHFSRVTMSLIGESARRDFLRNVGESLEQQNADISHKWAWAEIVKKL